MAKQTKRSFPTLTEMFDLEDKYGAALGSRFSLGLPTSVQPSPSAAPKPKQKGRKKSAIAPA